MLQNVRNLIFICFSRADATPQLDFRMIFENQFKGVNLAKNGDLKVEFFVDEQIKPGQVWQQQILDALSRTKVALILEGTGLMTSAFVQEVEIPKFLADAARDGVTIFRIPVRSVSPFLIPEGLKRLQTVHPMETPLEALRPAKRNAAITKIVNKVMDAYQNNSILRIDELDSPPFKIAVAESVTLFPERLLSWVDHPRFASLNVPLHPGYRSFLEGLKFNNEFIQPKWRFGTISADSAHRFFEIAASFKSTLKEFASAADKPTVVEALERRAAKSYPRFRDAQLALYYMSRRSHGEAAKDQLKHAKSIMTSIFRKHGEFWQAVNDMQEPIKAWDKLAEIDDHDKHQMYALFENGRSIPSCELGILCRLDAACDKSHPYSLEKCHQLLDRICHWTQMANRLMNFVLDAQPLAGGK